MIPFHEPQLSDKAWADPILAHSGQRGCEYNFTSLFVWRRAYRHCIAQRGDMMFNHVCTSQGCAYLCPGGEGDLREAVEFLRADAQERGEGPLRLMCVTPSQIARLERAFPGQFDDTPQRDGWDYIYDINRLADLPGKKLHAKRNHIRRFEEAHPDWTFEPLSRENLEECLQVDRDWYLQSCQREGIEEAWDLRAETLALRDAVDHFEALKLDGGLIRTGGQVVAFTIGDRLGADGFDVHFEKAYAQIQGAYAIINREFARYIRDRYPDVRWFNREEDMGLEGLRKAKLSYYPDAMVEKHMVVWRK